MFMCMHVIIYIYIYIYIYMLAYIHAHILSDTDVCDGVQEAIVDSGAMLWTR